MTKKDKPGIGGRNRELACYGEEAAAKELRKQGYKIIERNFSCPIGEIDIIAIHGKVLVFVEVKTRKSCYCGLPEESVNWQKQVRLSRVACWFLKERKYGNISVRFDVVSVLIDNGGPVIRIIQRAFDADSF